MLFGQHVIQSDWEALTDTAGVRWNQYGEYQLCVLVWIGLMFWYLSWYLLKGN